MHGVACPSCYGDLTIDGIDLSNPPAWCVERYDDLWALPILRGSNVPVPGADGVTARGWALDSLTALLALDVCGDYDELAALWNGDRQVGLQNNLDYLYDNLVAKPGTVGEVRTATFTKPDATVFTGDVQVRGWRPRFLPGGYARVALTLEFPGGLVAAGTVTGS